jgi:hypothetical protein
LDSIRRLNFCISDAMGGARETINDGWRTMRKNFVRAAVSGRVPRR